MMLKFRETKKPIKMWDVNVGNIAISKLVKTKTKYIRPLVLIMPKMSGYIKTFKIKTIYWCLSIKMIKSY